MAEVGVQGIQLLTHFLGGRGLKVLNIKKIIVWKFTVFVASDFRLSPMNK